MESALDLRAREIGLTKIGRTIERMDLKNGNARRVDLLDWVTAAVDALRTGKIGADHPFTLKSVKIACRWRRLRNLADCANLRLHNVR